jgi:DNA-binding XRE family transcriptional regulator
MYRELTRLREHRWRRTLTQDELEKLAGVSRPTIAGSSSATEEHIPRLWPSWPKP